MPNAKKTWVRARQPEQKEARRQAILTATAELLDSEGLDATGLNAIARRVGVAKANLYRYFESREAILLELLLDEVRDWAENLSKRLHRHRGKGDPDRVARAFADTMTSRRRFCILIGSLASVLEHNVSSDTIAAFKREFQTVAEPAFEALAAALPALAPDDAHRVLATLVMSATGVWPHCHPAPVVEEVLAQKEFAHMQFDFAKTMRDLAANYLRGLLAND